MNNAVFLYFAYGSNLLAQRIHVNNPTAVRRGPGKLPGYRLDFNGYSDYWDGSPATIVPDADAHVWGAIWTLNVSDLENLDRQEGVPDGVYAPFEANVVVGPNGETASCRSYLLVNQPSNNQLTLPLPVDRRPSKSYLKTILLGATESQLPSDYLQTLQAILDNGRDGPSMPWLLRS